MAKSNILVNAPIQAKYFYQDLDASGGRLNGANRYTMTFAKDQTPPVNGFWSLTLYNEHHFFAPNELRRYSLGTKNKTLKTNPDGSLTFYVQADPPPQAQRDNWLPAPKGADFSLFMRAYWPKPAVARRLVDAAGGTAREPIISAISMSAYDRYCCKSILSISSRSVDSRSGTNALQQFKRARAPKSIVTKFHFTEPAWRLLQQYRPQPGPTSTSAWRDHGVANTGAR